MQTLFDKLSVFISDDMSMQQIYQPVMLIELLSNKGSASVKDIAEAIAIHDPTQVEYYQETVKRMVGEVLTKKRGITEKIRDGRKIVGYRIKSADELTDEQRKKLIDLCSEKLDQYLQDRGNALWDHRRTSAEVPGSIRYEVLKKAKRRCELCGISANEKALDVDHIVPKNKDGSNDISNLQALCYSCNRAKRDTDDTDFREVLESYKDRKKDCLFCEIPAERVIAENELFYAIKDGYPVTDGHMLFIPKRHVETYFELYQPELNSLNILMAEVKIQLSKNDGTITGFNIGVNNGADAGQTIFHCHIHLIPRRKGDMADPRGGVRGVIPEKMKY